MELIKRFATNLSLIPYGHCDLWPQGLVSLHVLSDSIIALSYYLIALALIYVVQRREDVPFRGLFWLFAAFIGLCGTTHMAAVWILWFPTYWISGSLKALTALVSLWTALKLLLHLPAALEMPSRSQLEQLNLSLSQEVANRKATESASHQLNDELEQRVAARTQELEQAQEYIASLLQQEQVARLQVESTLEDLKTAAERLNIALSAADMGSWDWDLAQQHLVWSPKTYAILDVPTDTPASDLYNAWRERVHPEDVPQVEAAIAQAQETQQPFVKEYRIQWSDDTFHWVLAQGQVQIGAEGNPRRMIGVLQETTEAKQAELNLRASEMRFRAVFEQAAVGMARLAPDGRWLQVNQTLCEMLGYTAEELVGQPFWDFTNPADYGQDDRYYHQLLNGEKTSARFEKRYLHKDGSSIWAVVTVSTERSETDDLTAFIAVIEDVRLLKQARLDLEERAAELEAVNGMLAMSNTLLEKRNAELDQFAYVASHDLKAPLRAIANLSEWIEEDLGTQIPTENQRQLELLRSRVYRMEALISGLLEYSRVGRRERQVEDIQVSALLADIVDSLSPSKAFVIALPDNPLTLTANRVALRQVFANLISNAIKHHDRDSGHIQITASDQGDLIEFAVTDDGPGIDPQYHEKIFTIFQTLKARDEFESTGIGLSIVRKIVEAEGGRIWLDSAIGKGSAFHFTWHKV
ncbi:PAS domain-containing protein [Vacuolonema iberomarrocanum]|uniref:sensor histidine kinase n=1 Tax=Vacuolonema iberomarrocanum TaxID=3454632 RepID=UPI0019DA3036|nr:PAS domain S-box protein [filamentous cyanobacterium LEGE 07170]